MSREPASNGQAAMEVALPPPVEDSPLSETLTRLPSYVARGLVYLVLLFLTLFLLYASVSQIDVHLTAPARLIPEGKATLIQPDIEGILTQLPVKEGDRVVQGQMLAVVESREVSTYLLALQAAEVELADAQKESREIAPLKIHQLATQVQLLQQKITHLKNSRKALEQKQAAEEASFQLAQETYGLEVKKQDELQRRLELEAQSADRNFALWKKELEINERLREKGVVSEFQLVLTRRSYEEAITMVHKLQSLVRDAASERQLLHKRFAKTKLEHERVTLDLQEQIEQNRFSTLASRQEIQQKQDEKRLVEAEAARKLTLILARHAHTQEAARLNLHSLDPETRAQLAQGKGSATNRAVITAPTEGRIAHVLVRNQGEAVRRGQTLMTLLPRGAALVAQMQIANKDISLVKKGQEVRFKFDTFPFAEYGVLLGELTNVLPDADPGQGATSYQAYARLERGYFRVKGEEVELLSGMTATAEIVSERKTLLEFLLKPFKDLQEPQPAQP